MPFNQPGYTGGNAMKPILKPAMIHVKGLMGGDLRVRMGKYQPVFRGPGADQMDGFLPLLGIKAPPDSLPVYGDDLPLDVPFYSRGV
jgi:hypothetical protein